MKFELYSVKDCVAEEFGPIFQCKNDAVACRMFGNMFNVKEAKDLSLFSLGFFDTEKGIAVHRPKEVDTSNVLFTDAPIVDFDSSRTNFEDLVNGASVKKAEVNNG